jgi:hypothetical protein
MLGKYFTLILHYFPILRYLIIVSICLKIFYPYHLYYFPISKYVYLNLSKRGIHYNRILFFRSSVFQLTMVAESKMPTKPRRVFLLVLQWKTLTARKNCCKIGSTKPHWGFHCKSHSLSNRLLKQGDSSKRKPFKIFWNWCKSNSKRQRFFKLASYI